MRNRDFRAVSGNGVHARLIPAGASDATVAWSARREGWGASWALHGKWTLRAASGCHQLVRAAVGRMLSLALGMLQASRRTGRGSAKAGIRMVPAHAAVNGSEAQGGRGADISHQALRSAPPAPLSLRDG